MGNGHRASSKPFKEHFNPCMVKLVVFGSRPFNKPSESKQLMKL